MSDKDSTAAILAALAGLHPDASWLFVTEVGDPGSGQRIDAYAASYWKSRGNERIAYEAKASRSDFLRELGDPEKRRFALDVSHRFYFATPPGLVQPGELPAECGLVEIDGDGTARIVVEAPWRDTADPPLSFLLSLPRRAFQLGKAAGAKGRAPTGWRDVERLARSAAGLSGRTRWSAIEGALRNLAASLRSEGFHAEARQIDRIRRDGAAREQQRLARLHERLARDADERASPPPRDEQPAMDEAAQETG